MIAPGTPFTSMNRRFMTVWSHGDALEKARLPWCREIARDGFYEVYVSDGRFLIKVEFLVMLALRDFSSASAHLFRLLRSLCITQLNAVKHY